MKIAYNACFGGFSLSHEGVMRYAELKGIKLYPFVSVLENGRLTDNFRPYDPDRDASPWSVHYCTERAYSEDAYFSPRDIDRGDAALIATIEQLGSAASGACAALALAEVPSGTRYRIDEYDGNERVMTVDDYDWKVAP